MVELRFNDVGEGINEGKIVTWERKEGDKVNEGDVLVSVETAKITVEITSPTKGTVFKIYKKEKEEIQVGDLLVHIQND
ncbi:biotin/lipoyl-containing protein [Candidatus Phytoplasma pini]|uniref:biotin/lipoyl-containing protein n=1 Tax=Candidatus Phytoplasma pini TaxID=267362 RepID=UPI001FEAACB2|nr:biotin/lipoyl-containing protein [Candidatus Phytoplasma pini]